jgi:hypothetical protein
MDAVAIDAVERDHPAPALLGCWLDAPRPGDGVDHYSFTLRGWAVGRDAAVEAFQVLDGERIVADVAPNQHRPDIVESFAGSAEVGTAGFEEMVQTIELEPSFAVEVVVLLADGTRARMATVRGRRSRMALPCGTRLNPVMLTTIGRSGSKWLALLLSCHPSIVAFQPLVFEPHVATYWSTVFRTLTDPQSYMRQIHAERLEEHRWWLGDDAAPVLAPIELGMASWLGTDAVHDLAAVCRRRTEAFYLELAKRAGKGEVRYFAEKFLLDRVLLDLTLECFPGAREVILVRDFRDRLSSVFAWNERHGDHGFGHDAQMSKRSYLTERVLVDARDLLERWQRQGERAHLVRYEDLVVEPLTTLAALFDYLDIDSDPATLGTVLELAAKPGALSDSHRTVDDPLQTIGRWRRDLPPELAEECNQILAPALEAFGYPLDTAAVETAG